MVSPTPQANETSSGATSRPRTSAKYPDSTERPGAMLKSPIGARGAARARRNTAAAPRRDTLSLETPTHAT
eukprot:7493921-Pyramimonas_sp.AAC.1